MDAFAIIQMRKSGRERLYNVSRSSKEQSHMGSSPGPKALNYHTMLLSSHGIKLLVQCNDISLGKYPSYPHVTNGEIRP